MHESERLDVRRGEVRSGRRYCGIRLEPRRNGIPTGERTYPHTSRGGTVSFSPVPHRVIKLFYTSNMPIMLESALTSNVFIVSHMLATRFPSNILVRLLGVWEVRHAIKYNMISELTVIVRCSPWKTPQLVVTSGIAYYMSPPHTIKEILDPIHTAIYITFMLSACALLSKTWIEVSRSGPWDVAKRLKDQQMVHNSCLALVSDIDWAVYL
jgi:preprotein translocase subunit SecY